MIEPNERDFSENNKKTIKKHIIILPWCFDNFPNAFSCDALCCAALPLFFSFFFIALCMFVPVLDSLIAGPCEKLTPKASTHHARAFPARKIISNTEKDRAP